MRLYGKLQMTKFRIQVWCDVSGDRAYVLDTYGTYEEAERAAKKCCEGLPYSFAVEEESAVGLRDACRLGPLRAEPFRNTKKLRHRRPPLRPL